MKRHHLFLVGLFVTVEAFAQAPLFESKLVWDSYRVSFFDPLFRVQGSKKVKIPAGLPIEAAGSNYYIYSGPQFRFGMATEDQLHPAEVACIDQQRVEMAEGLALIVDLRKEPVALAQHFAITRLATTLIAMRDGATVAEFLRTRPDHGFQGYHAAVPRDASPTIAVMEYTDRLEKPYILRAAALLTETAVCQVTSRYQIALAYVNGVWNGSIYGFRGPRGFITETSIGSEEVQLGIVANVWRARYAAWRKFRAEGHVPITQSQQFRLANTAVIMDLVSGKDEKVSVVSQNASPDTLTIRVGVDPATGEGPSVEELTIHLYDGLKEIWKI